MSRPVLTDDIFRILNSYEARFQRIETALHSPRTTALEFAPPGAGADVSISRTAAGELTVTGDLKVTGSQVYSGGTTFNSGVTINGTLTFGSPGDVNLYRQVANVLKTDDLLSVQGFVTWDATANAVFVGYTGPSAVGAGLAFGQAADTNIYRSAADNLKTDDTFIVGSQIVLYPTGNNGALVMVNSTGNVLRNFLASGDANPTFRIAGNGDMWWGAGGASAVDTVLYRAQADVLRTNDLMSAARAAAADAAFGAVITGNSFHSMFIRADGQILWGPGNVTQDTNLYRNGVDILRTDDSFQVGGTLTVTGASTLTGAATLSSTLAVTGTSTFTGRTTHNAGGSVAGGQHIDFGSSGVADPSATSAGWKLKLYGNDYGFGIAASTLWALHNGNFDIWRTSAVRSLRFEANGIYLYEGWFRAPGSNGFYWSDRGVGWQSTGSDWIRAYESGTNRRVYSNQQIRTPYMTLDPAGADSSLNSRLGFMSGGEGSTYMYETFGIRMKGAANQPYGGGVNCAHAVYNSGDNGGGANYNNGYSYALLHANYSSIVNKTNVVDIFEDGKAALARVKGLRPRKWDNLHDHTRTTGYGTIGFIAEEVRNVDDQLVYEQLHGDGVESDMSRHTALALDPTAFVALLVSAVKHLAAEVEALKAAQPA